MCAQVAVCTPGRMIDLIKMKACSCRRVTYLVFDEADRMFDMGFEPQARRGMGFFDLISTMKEKTETLWLRNFLGSASASASSECT